MHALGQGCHFVRQRSVIAPMVKSEKGLKPIITPLRD